MFSNFNDLNKRIFYIFFFSFQVILYFLNYLNSVDMENITDKLIEPIDALSLALHPK